MKKVSKLLLIIWAFLLIGCTTQGTSWDIDAYAPVAETTMDLSNLIGDQNLQVQSDSAVWLNIDETVFSFEVDTLTQFPTFATPYSFLWPGVPTTLPAGTAIPTQEIPISLLNTGIELRELKLQEGKLKLSAKSTAAETLIFTYYSPAASIGGISFSFTDTIRGLAVGEDTVLYEKEFDLAGYKIITTGPNNDQLNTFSTYIDVTVGNNPIPLATNQLIFKITNELSEMKPSYGKGYLGQYDFSQSNVTAKLDVMKSFVSGLLDVEQLSLNLTVHNSIGADVKFKPVYFTATNNRTGSSVSLIHPGMGNTVNINRAFETGIAANPVNPTFYTYSFTSGNSNIESIVELLPDEITFSADMKLNPYGNIAGYTDFYYLDYPAHVQMQLQAPLKFSLSQLMFVDTLTNPFAAVNLLDDVVDGQFTIRAENKFPVALNLQLYTLDNMGATTDSVMVNDLIPAAPVDATNRVVAPVSVDLIASVNASKLASLKSATSIRIKAMFNTQPAAAGRLQMYIDYYLKIKLIADIKYHIEL